MTSASVELFVALPYEKWKSMDHKLRKDHELHSGEVPNHTPVHQEDKDVIINGENLQTQHPLTEEEEMNDNKGHNVKEPLGQDLSKKYRTTQIVKLLTSYKGYKELDNIDNLENLVKSSLGNSAKVLPNEKEFYDLVFQTNLAPYVKNRHKIRKYYKKKWYQI